MRELAGRAAFVTGGASGLGLAMARAFAEAGVKVMVADIDEEVLAGAVEGLQPIGPEIRGVVCDVADPASVDRAAEAAFGAFGNIHILCNNAGVNADGNIGNISLRNWRWLFDVNVMGVVHGLRAFVPHMRAHGEGGHIVNTGSMSGITNNWDRVAPYPASKFAVVGMSEGLAIELKPFGIGVSVLCPGQLETNLGQSGTHRQERYGGPMPRRNIKPKQRTDPSIVAERVLEAIRNDELYIFTHPATRRRVVQRFRAILAAYDKIADARQ